MEPALTALPGETGSLVALCNEIAAVPLPDWPHRHPLALPTVIRTVNIVLPNGATLGSGIRTVALQPLSHETGYRNLTPNRDGAQLTTTPKRTSEFRAFNSLGSAVCAVHGEQT